MAKVIDNLGAPIGHVRNHTKLSTPDGWLFCDGRTIGNSGSGATAYANPDCFDLFVHIWSNFSGAALVLQDSSGSPVAQGASAVLDWNNLRRIGLPDYRGRVGAGRDNMGGTNANRLTGTVASTVNGQGGGANLHTLTQSEIPVHSHVENANVWMNSSPVPPGGNNFVTRVGGGAFMTVDTPGGGQRGPQSTGSTGGSLEHNNTQPTIITQFIIKY